MTIEEFIEARITEREKAAKAAEPHWSVDVERNPEIYGALGEDIANHVMWHDPAEVLRQCAFACEALDAYRTVFDARRLREQHATNAFTSGQDAAAIMWLDWVLRGLAAIWSDHPDYQQDWAI